MTTAMKLISGAFLASLMLAAGPVQAAKAPKVDICHFDADEGVYKPMSIHGNAQSKHIEKHGDLLPNVADPETGLLLDEDCFAVMEPEPEVWARAYIDKNRNGTYDGDTDIDIAWVEDTNQNGTLDVGDTVIFGQYPTTFDPCQDPQQSCTDIGNFTQTEVEIAAIYTNTETVLHVGSLHEGSVDEEVRLSSNVHNESIFTFNHRNGGGNGDCALQDDYFNNPHDGIFINVNCPGAPEAEAFPPFDTINGDGKVDDYWLEIGFNYIH